MAAAVEEGRAIVFPVAIARVGRSTKNTKLPATFLPAHNANILKDADWRRRKA